jgi:hypothetical protein
MDALSPTSSYAAKKTDIWDDLTDRIAGAMWPAVLDEVEDWIAWHEMDVPWAWREPLTELIEKRRDELAEEDISQILLDRFDFT